MKWTVKIERIDEAGILHSTTVGYQVSQDAVAQANAAIAAARSATGCRYSAAGRIGCIGHVQFGT
jgi:hypothetical protein